MVRRAPREDSEDADPSLAALQAQKRILQIKRERDERIQDTVREADALMDALKSRIAAHRHAQTSHRAQEQAQRVARVLELVEERREIETRVGEVIKSAWAVMVELGDLMGVAVDGRLGDARSCLKDLRIED